MQKLTIPLLMLFAVPWEYSLDLGEPFGNVARILGIALLMAAVPWVLISREMRRPGVVQWLVLALYLYFACSYYWTLEPEMTIAKIRAYLTTGITIVWIVWESLLIRLSIFAACCVRLVAGCWVLAILTLFQLHVGEWSCGGTTPGAGCKPSPVRGRGPGSERRGSISGPGLRSGGAAVCGRDALAGEGVGVVLCAGGVDGRVVDGFAWRVFWGAGGIIRFRGATGDVASAGGSDGVSGVGADNEAL